MEYLLVMLPVLLQEVTLIGSQQPNSHVVYADKDNPAALQFYHYQPNVNQISCDYGENNILTWNKFSTNKGTPIRGPLENRAAYIRGTKSLLITIDTVKEHDTGVYRCQFLGNSDETKAHYDVTLKIGSHKERGTRDGQATCAPCNNAGERAGFVVVGAALALLVAAAIWLILDYCNYKKQGKAYRSEDSSLPIEKRTVKSYVASKFTIIRDGAVSSKASIAACCARSNTRIAASCARCRTCRKTSKTQKSDEIPALNNLDVQKLSAREKRLIMAASGSQRISKGDELNVNLPSHISQSPMPSSDEQTDKDTPEQDHYIEVNEEREKKPHRVKTESIYANIPDENGVSVRFQREEIEKTDEDSKKGGRKPEKVKAKPALRPKPQLVGSKQGLETTKAEVHA